MPSALVVDADARAAKLTGLLLEQGNFDARITHSAEAALMIVEWYRPDIIVIELVLPLMSGLVLARTLRGNRATRAIPIIVVTALAGAEQAARAAGCNMLVRKPIDVSTFTSQIESVVSASR